MLADYHKWRWRLVTLWVIVFSGYMIYSVHVGKLKIHDIAITKASIKNLQITDCTLERFLVSARKIRLKQASLEKGQIRQVDLRGATLYTVLIKSFSKVEGCHED